MADGTRKPVFWPVMFIGAFSVGALLWCLWMVWAVEKTKRIRPDDFFVPTAPAVPGGATNTATSVPGNGTNGMTAGTNR